MTCAELLYETICFRCQVIRSAGIKNVLRFITEMQHGKDSGTLYLTGNPALVSAVTCDML
jgi:hypothetical protein